MELGRMESKGRGFIGNLRRVQEMIDEISKESEEAVLYECDKDAFDFDEFLVIKFDNKIYVVTQWYEAEKELVN